MEGSTITASSWKLQWILHRNGETGGPYDADTIVNWISQGMYDGAVRPALDSSATWLSLAEFLEQCQFMEFQHLVGVLVSIHKECGPSWNWQELARAGAPEPPSQSTRNVNAATAAMHSYRPSLSQKLLGGDKKQRASLAFAVEQARTADHTDYAQAMQQYQLVHDTWACRRALAERVLQRDVTAYEEALHHAGAFVAVSAHGLGLEVSATEPDLVVLACEILDDQVIPSEELKLTATGKTSTREMPAARYWALYQDFICSCALRTAREVFAVLPVSRVIANVGTVQTNTATGHPEMVTLLAVHITRDGLARLNLNNIDPSDSMVNFDYRMVTKKTCGLEPVTPLGPEDQFITT